jgi:hypothetical protein
MKLPKTFYLTIVLLLLGVSCVKQTPVQPVETPEKITPEKISNEPFDTADYLDQALEDLDAL